MKLNHYILKIGIGLIVLITLLGIGFSYYTKINSPVFLKYCIEVPIPNQEDIPNSQIILELSYITNSTDKNSVVGISFPDAPEMSFSALERNNFYGFQNTGNNVIGTQYGKYCIRTVSVYLNQFDQADWIGEKKLHQAKIQISNGDIRTVDLGEIILYRDKQDNNELISMQRSSSSNDGTSSSYYQVEGTVELESVESSAFTVAKDLLEFKIGGIDYKEFSAMDHDKVSSITITAQFGDLQNKKSSFDIYDIRPKLYYKISDGTTGYTRIYNVSQRRWFSSYKEVLKYLIERGIF